MNIENTNKLYEKYPELYRGRTKPLQQSLMAWGFQCPDEWFTLIDVLSGLITNHCNKNNLDIPEVFQVKEKFGGLRFYVEHVDVVVDAYIQFAEELSYEIKA